MPNLIILVWKGLLDAVTLQELNRMLLECFCKRSSQLEFSASMQHHRIL